MKHRYSTISLFQKCQQLYKYVSIDKLDDGSSRAADLTFGTAVHLGVQDLFEGGDGVDIFRTFWAMKEDQDFGRLNHEQLMKLGCDLLEIFRDEQKKHFIPDFLERKLEAQLGDVVYSGTVDFLGQYKGVTSVVDWKTSAMPYDNYKIRCNEQMYGYAYLASSVLKYEAKQAVYGVAVKDPKNPRWQIKVAPLTQALVLKHMANLELLAKNIEATTEYAKNSTMCLGYKKVCPFFNKCFPLDKPSEDKA